MKCVTEPKCCFAFIDVPVFDASEYLRRRIRRPGSDKTYLKCSNSGDSLVAPESPAVPWPSSLPCPDCSMSAVRGGLRSGRGAANLGG
jgi:hypothetical protein